MLVSDVPQSDPVIHIYIHPFSESFPLQGIEYSSPSNRADLCCFIYFICAVPCLVAQSRATLCDPQTAARQASLSVRFSRQEHRSGLSFPPPGHLPNPGKMGWEDACAPCVSCIGMRILYHWATGKPIHIYSFTNKILVLFGIPFNYPKDNEEFPDPMDNWVEKHWTPQWSIKFLPTFWTSK